MDFLQIEWRSEWYEKAVRLRDDLLRRPLGLAFTAADLAEEARQWHYGLADGEELVAIVVIVPLTAHRVKLRQMAVTPTRQQQGLGTLLIKRVEDVLREQGIQEIELNARDFATSFYEQLGYQRQGEVFIEVSLPHYKMVKKI